MLKRASNPCPRTRPEDRKYYTYCGYYHHEPATSVRDNVRRTDKIYGGLIAAGVCFEFHGKYLHDYDNAGHCLLSVRIPRDGEGITRAARSERAELFQRETEASSGFPTARRRPSFAEIRNARFLF